MKKTAILVTTICAATLIAVSCSSDNNENTTSTDITTVGASLAVDAANEMDVNTGLFVTSTPAAAKTAETPVGLCATITVTTPNGTQYPRVFLVDFGTGCTDNNIIRKGKLKITLSGPIINTGSKMTIERIDYSMSGIKLEGTIEYTNITTVATVPQWTRKVINGKLTDNQGKVYNNSGIYTTKQTAGVETPFVLTDNVYEIPEGTHTVTAADGTTLTLTVKETLIKRYSCLFISKGQLQIKGGILNGVVDYGNDTCDSFYIYTHENGTSFNLSF
ncbi:hypothetical protein [Flavobacterium sp. ACN6]|uniref:hypothetical protein n=1 Tax=Flavobacterium sp. ACN6 TaxID=1920426 RepID=UPI000BB3E184|nr:hypothetical protein [Flavobacterium sp. ACN6]PBJ13802.1 hypothetical protein BSF42_12790 [Flavobacterium sp. ACN6]